MSAPEIERPTGPPIGWEDMSLIERLAVLPEAEQEVYLSDLIDSNPDFLDDPEIYLRPQQLNVVNCPAWVALFAAGRGTGKTKTGANWVIKRAQTPDVRFSLLGRTVADVRDVMVQGPAGILANSPPDFMPIYTPSLRKLVWPNGSEATTYSSDVPDQLRGPQAHYGWADELAAFKLVADSTGLTAWDNLLLSTRLGKTPQILATTTPKRTELVRELFRLSATDSEHYRLFQAGTLSNRANLSPEYIEAVWQRYGGTNLERQELYGELIGDSPGALWRSGDIVIKALPDYTLDFVIGVDPGVSAGQGDATGIMVVAADQNKDITQRKAWVVDDHTSQGAPEQWAKAIVDAHNRYSAPGKPAVVVVEGNQGGELLRLVLRQLAPSLPIAIVKAVRSKQARAEPVVLAYRQGRVFHTREFPELVDELVGWEPDSKWSPNRLDAVVWALSVSLVDPRPLYPHMPVSVGTGAADVELARGVIPEFRRGRPSPGVGWRSQPAYGPMSGGRRR